ncbi:MAG: HAD family phosphatase [Clostridiales bacterium]|nr:HAD family phosphatase [Clostridiales bacterium]
MVKGIIFDMDGVVFDTERLSTMGWLKCGEELGIELDMKFINSFKGTARSYSRRLFKDRFGEDFDYDGARDIRTKFITDYINEFGVPIKKGFNELIAYTKNKGILTAVATSTGRDLAEFYFEKADVKKCFDAFVYGDTVERGKPAPDIFLKAADMLGLKCEECIVIEDSPAGIKAGQNAGIRVVAVPDMIPFDKDIMKSIDYCVGSLDIAANLIVEGKL